MEIKYSKTKFEGYTYRFIVRFSVDNDWRNDTIMNIYSNEGDKRSLRDFIENKKTNKVKSYIIEHRTTKEQDDMEDEFINEWLNEELK